LVEELNLDLKRSKIWALFSGVKGIRMLDPEGACMNSFQTRKGVIEAAGKTIQVADTDRKLRQVLITEKKITGAELSNLRNGIFPNPDP
jgi:hypothetical protein